MTPHEVLLRDWSTMGIWFVSVFMIVAAVWALLAAIKWFDS